MSAFTRSAVLAAAASILLLTAASPVASARPDDGGTDVRTVTGPVQCELMRIGTQLIRCDNLTGAGAPAPLWIPELTGAL
jgi:hypothetical protein